MKSEFCKVEFLNMNLEIQNFENKNYYPRKNYTLYVFSRHLYVRIFLQNMTVLSKYSFIYLARTPGIGQGLGRILSCGACKPEQT